MNYFDELLKRTLSIVNVNYESSLNGVKKVVEQLAQSIEKNAGSEFVFEMIEVSSDINGSVHKIYLDPDINNDSGRLIVIGYIQIPVTGFPIKLGRYNKTIGFTELGEELKNSEDVDKYFASLLEEPNSKLIQAIGYALRLKANRDAD